MSAFPERSRPLPLRQFACTKKERIDPFGRVNLRHTPAFRLVNPVACFYQDDVSPADFAR
jgi:hypothetical protein